MNVFTLRVAKPHPLLQRNVLVRNSSTGPNCDYTASGHFRTYNLLFERVLTFKMVSFTPGEIPKSTKGPLKCLIHRPKPKFPHTRTRIPYSGPNICLYPVHNTLKE